MSWIVTPRLSLEGIRPLLLYSTLLYSRLFCMSLPVSPLLDAAMTLTMTIASSISLAPLMPSFLFLYFPLLLLPGTLWLVKHTNTLTFVPVIVFEVV